jgi:hypothetical protein
MLQYKYRTGLKSVAMVGRGGPVISAVPARYPWYWWAVRAGRLLAWFWGSVPGSPPDRPECDSHSCDVQNINLQVAGSFRPAHYLQARWLC